MSISATDINTLRAAIQQYQAAVRQRDAEEQAQREAARLQREENMKAVGSVFKGIFILAAIALVIYVLFQIDWGVVGERVGVILGCGILLLILPLFVFCGVGASGKSSLGESIGAAVLMLIIELVILIPVFHSL